MPNRRAQKHTTGLMLFKFLTLLLAAVVTLVFMAFRIHALITEHGEAFERRTINQLVNRTVRTEASVMPNRGAILDRNHQTLAFSSIVYDVFMDVRLLSRLSETRRTEIIQTAADILNMPEEQLLALLARNEDGSLVFDFNDRTFARGQSLETALALQAARLPHIHIRQNTQRTYVYGNVAPQVIGFERGGVFHGLEARFNRELTGVPGRVFRVFDANGLGIVTERVEPQHGDTLVLSLDLMIQKMFEEGAERFGTRHNAAHVTAIAMSVETGGIVAMAAYPSFNLNEPMNPAYLSSPWLAEEWAELDSHTLALNFNSVWQNFNITHTFEPGSVFKPITVAAALEENVISIDDRFFCGGSLVFAGHTMRCHVRRGCGWLDLRQVIAQSCNVALMQIAEKMGAPTFYRYQRYFGFGERTGIDLPAEASARGLLHALVGLNASELAASSFGQTFNVTPIQAITAFTALINGGNLFQPYVVSQIIDQNNRVVFDRRPEVVRQVLSQEVSDWLRCAMVDTFVTGTGRRARLPDHDIGGKSGTALQGLEDDPDHYVATAFIGYFPADDPQYVVMTIIYNTGDGTTIPAAYLFSELVLGIINYRRIPPAHQTGTGTGTGTTLGSYIDMSVQEAVRIMNRLNLDFHLVGDGDTVVGHWPRPGDRISPTAAVFLMVENHGREELTQVPDTEGMTLRQARAAITEAGLTPFVIFDEPGLTYDDVNIVFQQAPEPWQRVGEGTEVAIRVRIW